MVSTAIAETVVCGLFSLIPVLINSLRGIKCGSIVGIVIPKGSGKTTISKAFVKDDNTELIDLENAIRLNVNDETLKKLDELKQKEELTSYNSKYYVLAKEYIKGLKKNFKNKTYYILSSDKDLLKYIGAKDIYTFTPSNDFFNKIKSNLDPEEARLAETNRTNILLSQGRRDLLVFNSFEELSTLLNKVLKLKHKL